MKHDVPARLHVIPASGSPKALILRRGPSEQVATILWDRRTDEFEMGQWLKGRIYEHRCDLSPDGRHMVYFAGKGGSYWTAVSRAPFLRALIFLPQSGTWGGGGAFDSKGRLWLSGEAVSDGGLPDGLKRAPDKAFRGSTDGFHLGDTYSTTLERRGWIRDSGTGYSTTLRRDVSSGWEMHLSFVISAENRAIVSNRYALVQKKTGRFYDQPSWEWAEPYGNTVQFAAKGQLRRTEVGAEGELHNTAVIEDFNNMAFEAIQAPYDGVSDQ